MRWQADRYRFRLHFCAVHIFQPHPVHICIPPCPTAQQGVVCICVQETVKAGKYVCRATACLQAKNKNRQ